MMLQIQPEKDIVIEFIKNEDFKYVRALGAYHLRLTGTALDCYKYLEPLLNDYRKIRQQRREENNDLEPRISVLEGDLLEEQDASSDEEQEQVVEDRKREREQDASSDEEQEQVVE